MTRLIKAGICCAALIALTLALILAPLKINVVEIMLCDTDFNSLLDEDHPYPISFEDPGETVPSGKRTELEVQ